MKVLHVIDQLNAGGAERVCVDLANLSCQYGLSVGILVLLNESKLDVAISSGVSIFYLKRDSKFNPKKYFEAAALCNQYDIIHIHMRHVYRYMVLVNLIGRVRARFILHDHFGDIHNLKQIPFLFSSLFKPSYYIGVSKELRDWAIRNLKLKSDAVYLLANIVRQSKSIGNRNPTGDLLIVSNIRRTKNIGFAIEIALALNLKLDIIGQVADVVYYEELKAIIRLKKTEGKIKFIHNCFEIQPCLNNYRLAVHTSNSETGPLVLMEYLSQGKNFLAFKTGEVAESLYPVFPQFFIETFEIEEWKGRVRHLLDNPIDKSILLSTFEKNYSEEKYYQTCLKIYQSILSC